MVCYTKPAFSRCSNALSINALSFHFIFMSFYLNFLIKIFSSLRNVLLTNIAMASVPTFAMPRNGLGTYKQIANFHMQQSPRETVDEKLRVF